MSLTPILQNEVLISAFLGKSMDINIDLIIQHRKASFQEDVIVLTNTSFEIGTSLLSQEIFFLNWQIYYIVVRKYMNQKE